MRTSTIAKLILGFIIVLFVIMLSSCSTQKRCERHLTKAKQLGCYKAINDTVEVEKTIKGDSIKIFVPVGLDSLTLDSLLNMVNDTCISKTLVKEIIKQVPINVIPYYKEDSLYKIKVWIENNKIAVDLKIKDRKYIEQKITTTKESIVEVEKVPLLYKIVLWILTFLILGLVFRKK